VVGVKRVTHFQLVHCLQHARWCLPHADMRVQVPAGQTDSAAAPAAEQQALPALQAVQAVQQLS
jgi:hypothetical protein